MGQGHPARPGLAFGNKAQGSLGESKMRAGRGTCGNLVGGELEGREAGLREWGR